MVRLRDLINFFESLIFNTILQSKLSKSHWKFFCDNQESPNQSRKLGTLILHIQTLKLHIRKVELIAYFSYCGKKMLSWVLIPQETDKCDTNIQYYK